MRQKLSYSFGKIKDQYLCVSRSEHTILSSSSDLQYLPRVFAYLHFSPKASDRVTQPYASELNDI